MFEMFDHTADLGLRVRSPDLPTLFAEAGQALLHALLENPESVQARRSIDIRLPADDVEFLLLDFLKTVLFHFEADKLLLCRFEVNVDESGLTARAWGETYDPPRHEPAHEVKAITYHDLVARKTDEGWLAEVIVDI